MEIPPHYSFVLSVLIISIAFMCPLSGSSFRNIVKAPGTAQILLNPKALKKTDYKREAKLDGVEVFACQVLLKITEQHC